MTATLTPRPPATRCAERSGFLRTLHAEWTKFRTVRGWVLAMAGALLVTIVVGLPGTAAPGGRGAGSASYPKGPGGEAVNDSFYFVHKTLTGDGALTVPLRSLSGAADTGIGKTAQGAQPWAKAGIIVKESLTQGAPYAAVMATGGHGVRKVTQESPRWLRLVRSGDSLTGSTSTDGSHWTKVGHAKLPGLARTVPAGLFATSPEAKQDTAAGTGFSPAVATGTFGRPFLTGGWSQSAWSGTQVGGDAGTSGSYPNTTKGGFTQTDGGGFTVTGAGDIAPVVGGPVMGVGFSAENFLVGTFAGLIVVTAVGTVFITGEYRRALLRTSLAATPLLGRVLDAKALVAGGVAFTIGLVAAAITIPIGERSARGRGFQDFPITSATEVRVMVGTGPLCAARRRARSRRRCPAAAQRHGGRLGHRVDRAALPACHLRRAAPGRLGVAAPGDPGCGLRHPADPAAVRAGAQRVRAIDRLLPAGAMGRHRRAVRIRRARLRSGRGAAAWEERMSLLSGARLASTADVAWRGGFGRALRAEWTKLRTAGEMGWLLLLAVALTVAVGCGTAKAVKCPDAGCGKDAVKVALTGVTVGQAVIAVLAVLAVSGEYGTGMIRTTLMAVPNRITLLTAKARVLTTVVLVSGTAAVLVSLLVGRYILPGNGFTEAHGYAPLSLAGGPTRGRPWARSSTSP
ncbi:hypothetical protein ACFYZB_46465 [Streptomyces sp. NPDC001852]|uniref:hypothetical protein n=1 Tax=Streptomyces sp. NPDC001852 TaxID=3364619 RepID=UPI0036BDF511